MIMELEEMKSLWEDMSQRVEKLELTNEKKLMELTQLKYKTKFSKLTSYERSGAVVCYLVGLFILFNITKLDTWYLMLCGVLTMSFLFILPIFSLGSLHNIAKINFSNSSYRDVLSRYENAKRRTLMVQKIGIASSFLIMFTVVPVADKILNDTDFFEKEITTSLWVTIAVAILFVVLVSRWSYGCYKKITASAENILDELNE